MSSIADKPIVSPQMPLRPPTFGDWLDCGDISRIVRTMPMAGEEAIEFRTNESAVLRWMVAATGLTEADIEAMPAPVGRAIYLRLVENVPAMAYAKPNENDPVSMHPDGLEITLSQPLPGPRQTYSTIKLRTPTFGDVISAGDITTTRVLKSTALGNGIPATEEVINPEAVGRWFMRLSGLPLPILALMPFRDAWIAFAHLRPLIAEISHENFGSPPSTSGSAAA